MTGRCSVERSGKRPIWIRKTNKPMLTMPGSLPESAAEDEEQDETKRRGGST